MPSVTYSDMIGDLIQLAGELNRRLGSLRDAAEEREKDVFNYGRGVLFELESKLNALETSLPEDRREMHLGGWVNNVITLGK